MHIHVPWPPPPSLHAPTCATVPTCKCTRISAASPRTRSVPMHPPPHARPRTCAAVCTPAYLPPPPPLLPPGTSHMVCRHVRMHLSPYPLLYTAYAAAARSCAPDPIDHRLRHALAPASRPQTRTWMRTGTSAPHPFSHFPCRPRTAVLATSYASLHQHLPSHATPAGIACYARTPASPSLPSCPVHACLLGAACRFRLVDALRSRASPNFQPFPF
ncbi:hypothetical protein DFH08DRAFT_968852 [Mycena albidolilacea]|uniref:Uncharacterized protein n=1 Tax=Mycena albidolilacea TaxID=1033008 RepID=A0AAD6ZI56_9AGAR|nr:hypothetical protein DFH08DRAFT_968852 [Mycena albidolilacea]